MEGSAEPISSSMADIWDSDLIFVQRKSSVIHLCGLQEVCLIMTPYPSVVSLGEGGGHQGFRATTQLENKLGIDLDQQSPV